MQHRVVAQLCRHAAVGIDVGEIHLAAFLEQPVRGGEHGVLVGDEVDHAIGDDDIEMAFGQAEFVEPLDIALDESDIRFGIAEPFAVPVEMGIGDFELFGRRIDPGHAAALADHLREDISVLPAARAEIEDMAAIDRLRRNQPAAEIARAHVGVDIGQRRQELGRRGLERAARIGLEIARPGQHLAIVIAAVFDVHVTSSPTPANAGQDSANPVDPPHIGRTPRKRFAGQP